MSRISAAVSPLVVMLAREVYIGLGGQLTLGPAGATAVRLLLAAAVLGVPTVLMGGTLPAAIKAVTHDDDAQRRRASLLYGLNTLGAVAGALLSTFFLLETFGTRITALVGRGGECRRRRGCVAALARSWSGSWVFVEVQRPKT